MANVCPIGFLAAYLDKFRVGLTLYLFPFLLLILRHYIVALAQLMPNAIKTIIGFYIHYLKRGVEPSIVLFRCFFMLKMCEAQGQHS